MIPQKYISAEILPSLKSKEPMGPLEQHFHERLPTASPAPQANREPTSTDVCTGATAPTRPPKLQLKGPIPGNPTTAETASRTTRMYGTAAVGYRTWMQQRLASRYADDKAPQTNQAYANPKEPTSRHHTHHDAIRKP